MVATATGLTIMAVVGVVTAVASVRRTRALVERIQLAREREQDPGSVEARHLVEFQIAHGIVSCPPGCDDPGHEQARALRSRTPRTDA